MSIAAKTIRLEELALQDFANDYDDPDVPLDLDALWADDPPVETPTELATILGIGLCLPRQMRDTFMQEWS